MTSRSPGQADAPDDLRLLRAFEPVVRLTQGEYFVPVRVDEYVRRCSLWTQRPDGVLAKVADPGALDLALLAQWGAALDGPGQSLSAVSVQASRWQRIKGWRRTVRPTFRAGNRLAEVGLFARVIDTLSRLSLLIRGAVPGGSALASLEMQQEHLRPDVPAYHGRVVRYGGYIVCQYWYFYAFNNWRSGFSGVNEHEADWEQVTVYLDGVGPVDEHGLPYPRWVVFSAHDETGDDLRRRWDDPDLMLVEDRHPVVFAGAGSHSGAYLAGDYLITVVPPRLGGIVPALRRAAKVLTPWTRAAQGSGLGIPYIDYARGDGLGIGPGQATSWSPVLIDDETPWVRDYRGLWGHDTRDRLGGERGPAGPRYERDATVRASWGDPVGWAGLAKVAPNREAELELVAQRLVEIDAELVVLDESAEGGRHDLAARAAGLPPGAPEVRALETEERRVSGARLASVRLRDERERMVRALRDGISPPDPHAHLRHRRTPLASSDRGRARLLSAWAIISTPLILLLVASLILPASWSRISAAVLMLLVVLAVEAFARGFLLAYLWRALLVIAIANLVVAFLRNWQVALAGVLAGTALVVLIVNVRDARRG